MFSNYINFLTFLRYLVEYKSDENCYCENITKVSCDDDNNPLIKSNELILNFENIRNNVFFNQKNKPSTVDGLYFKFDENHLTLSLYFIEFKGTRLAEYSFKTYFEDKILQLFNNQCKKPVEECPINDLNKKFLKSMFNSYTDNVSSILKTKPFESLFIIFAKICENYAEENDLEFSIKDYYSFILEKIRCHLIVVYKSGKNHINDQKTFVPSLEDKYNVLKNNGILHDFKIYDEIDFENNLLKDIQEFPMEFLNIIIPTSEAVLAETQSPQEFGNLIDTHINKNIEKLDMNLDLKQKKMLKRTVSKCCMDYIN